MSETKLSAEPRLQFGKGPSRQLRRENKIPAVLYGHGSDPLHVALPGHATMLALKVSNALLTIALDGKDQLALPKDVQRDPIRGTIEHVDLILVRLGEKVTVDVQVHVTGDAAPSALVNAEANSVTIEVEATAIPESLTLDVSGATPGTMFHASDLPLPAGATLVTDAEVLLVNVVDADAAAASQELDEPEAAPAAEAAPATES